MRVLLIEDEKELSRALESMLIKEKYEVDAAYDGAEGLEYALSGIYDIIILDVMMPRLDGYQVIKKMRENKIDTPVLMLTALSADYDKVKGLDLGADDYMAKPFSVSELFARVRALLRRRGKLVSDNKLSYSNCELDLSGRKIITQKGEIQLSYKEFEILRYLFEQPNFVADKDSLINKVWGFESEFESNNLEAYMSFLRKKLSHLECDFSIESVRGVGYKLSKKEKN